MGKTSVSSPGFATANRSAMDTLRALGTLFGKGPHGVKSLLDVQGLFEGLEDRQFERSIQQLQKTAEFQREQVGQNFEQSLSLSRKAIQSMRGDPLLSQFLDMDTSGLALDSVRKNARSEYAARGLGGSPIAATNTALKVGTAQFQLEESARNNRLQLARSVLGGSIPGAPQIQGTTSPTLFSQPGMSIGVSPSQIFGGAMQGGISSMQMQAEINTANAQFEQQWKHDMGTAAAAIAFL